MVLRARRSCITQHRSVSTALSLTMHVGATPSGPEPSGKNSNIFTVNWKRTHFSCAGAPMSHSSPCAATEWEFSERGSRGKTLLQKGFLPGSSLSETQLIPRPGKLVLSFGRRSSGFHLTHSAERLVPFPGNHKRCRNQEQCHKTHKDVSNKVRPLNCSRQPFRD